MGDIKQKRCQSCKELFTPVRRGLSVSKTCSLECDKAAPKKEKPKKKKEKTAAYLKVKVLWPIFSRYIKLKHSSDGRHCNCYTCGALLEIGTINCQGGHAVSKAVYKNLYFDERAVKPQCLSCNKHYGGMSYDFCRKLKHELGEEDFENMMSHGRDIIKRDRQWYLDAILEYTEKVKELELSKCKEV